MPRRVRPISHLYQVDFVASLFCGLLLIWLSGALEAENPTSSSESPIFFSLELQVVYASTDNRYPPIWISAVPEEAIKQSCVSPDLIKYTSARNSAMRPCVTDQRQPLPGTGTVFPRVHRAMGITNPSNENDLVAVGKDVNLEGSTFSFLGFALSDNRIRAAETFRPADELSVNAVPAASHSYITVGVLSDPLSLPKYMVAQNTFAVRALVAGYLKTMQAFADVEQVASLDLFDDNFDPRPQPYDPTRREARILNAILRTDLRHKNTCFYAQSPIRPVQATASQDRIEFRQC